jgi:hypothetical protein
MSGTIVTAALAFLAAVFVFAIPRWLIRRRIVCYRCGDVLRSASDAREFCVFTKCPHQRKATLGDLT